MYRLPSFPSFRVPNISSTKTTNGTSEPLANRARHRRGRPNNRCALHVPHGRSWWKKRVLRLNWGLLLVMAASGKFPPRSRVLKLRTFVTRRVREGNTVFGPLPQVRVGLLFFGKSHHAQLHNSRVGLQQSATTQIRHGRLDCVSSAATLLDQRLSPLGEKKFGHPVA